jgi:mannose-6-phosphate isomerase
MPKLDFPLRLTPVYKEKIWGRSDLAPIFDAPDPRRAQTSGRARSHRTTTPSERLIGEVWLTADESRFLNGPVAGLTLAEACRDYRAELLGEWNSGDDARFPILAKYLFTSDWLSVQVHPDDDYSRRHESGSPGKCEMWYIVKAERSGRYLLGAKPGVSGQTLRAACEEGASKTLLQKFRPRQGEAVFIPPGTVHALGPGLVLFEAEQNSDLTYRLDDFGRLDLEGKPRPLHLKEGLEVARLDLPLYRALPEIRLREPFGARRPVVACEFFAVEELLLHRSASFESSPRRVEILSVLEGEGRVETATGWMACRSGETWVIPPATGKYRVVPAGRIRLLKFYVPDIEKDFRAPLEKKRVRRKNIARICFG